MVTIRKLTFGDAQEKIQKTTIKKSQLEADYTTILFSTNKITGIRKQQVKEYNSKWPEVTDVQKGTQKAFSK